MNNENEFDSPFNANRLLSTYDHFTESVSFLLFRIRDEITVNYPSQDDFLNKSYSFFKKYQQLIWDNHLRMEWIERHILYRNLPIKKTFVGSYIEGYLNTSRMLFVNLITKAIITYANDFYPDFDTTDAFEREFKFPYEYMNLDCLFLVYKLHDRLKLLEVGEKNKMNLKEFKNYVAAFITETNEKTGSEWKFHKFYSGFTPWYVNRRLTEQEKHERLIATQLRKSTKNEQAKANAIRRKLRKERAKNETNI